MNSAFITTARIPSCACLHDQHESMWMQIAAIPGHSILISTLNEQCSALQCLSISSLFARPILNCNQVIHTNIFRHQLGSVPVCDGWQSMAVVPPPSAIGALCVRRSIMLFRLWKCHTVKVNTMVGILGASEHSNTYVRRPSCDSHANYVG